MERRTRRTALFAAVVALAGLVPPGAAAQEGGPPPGAEPSFSVQPSGPSGPGGRDYFVYDLAPGETFGDTVGVSNFSDQPMRFAVYATDAFNAERTAAFTLLKEEETPSDVGTWVQLGITEYDIPPGQRADIPFSVTVPTDAEPGDHVGAIVAQPLVAPVTNDDEVSFDVRLRIGARLYVRVEGPTQADLQVASLDLRHRQGLGPTSGAATIEYTVRNSGNLRVTPTAHVHVEGPFGITVRELDARELPELLPGGSFDVAETVKHLPLLGRLRVVVEVESPETSARAGTATWAIPWSVLAVVAAVGLALVLRRRRAERRGPPSPPAPPVRRGEKEPVPA